MNFLFNKPKANDIASTLSGLNRIPNCEDCELLLGANMLARRFFGKKYSALFDKNIASILTTHVDLNCVNCPVEQVMKKLKKDRLAAVAAIF